MISGRGQTALFTVHDTVAFAFAFAFASRSVETADVHDVVDEPQTSVGGIVPTLTGGPLGYRILQEKHPCSSFED